jgi:hypothetical protein
MVLVAPKQEKPEQRSNTFAALEEDDGIAGPTVGPAELHNMFAHIAPRQLDQIWADSDQSMEVAVTMVLSLDMDLDDEDLSPQAGEVPAVAPMDVDAGLNSVEAAPSRQSSSAYSKDGGEQAGSAAMNVDVSSVDAECFRSLVHDLIEVRNSHPASGLAPEPLLCTAWRKLKQPSRSTVETRRKRCKR